MAYMVMNAGKQLPGKRRCILNETGCGRSAQGEKELCDRVKSVGMEGLPGGECLRRGKFKLCNRACKRRFGDEVIAIAIKTGRTYNSLITRQPGTRFIGVVGQPVVQCLLRCNAEGENSQQNPGEKLTYERTIKHYRIATLLQN
jgi:hypothetical protein